MPLYVGNEQMAPVLTQNVEVNNGMQLLTYNYTYRTNKLWDMVNSSFTSGKPEGKTISDLIGLSGSLDVGVSSTEIDFDYQNHPFNCLVTYSNIDFSDACTYVGATKADVLSNTGLSIADTDKVNVFAISLGIHTPTSSQLPSGITRMSDQTTVFYVGAVIINNSFRLFGLQNSFVVFDNTLMNVSYVRSVILNTLWK